MKNKVLTIITLLFVVAFALTMFVSVPSLNASSEQDDALQAVVLKQGSTGSTVKTVQTKLKNWGYYDGSVDGIYGPKTVSAVKYFQRRNGLAVDGIVGAKTAQAMGITLSSSGSSGGYSSSDTYLLARAIYGEARGEPYLGQVAVAAVILNRVKDSKFPNTISGVIYQSGAFTCVSDGQINLTPNNTAIQAAKDAMSGWDPTNGCLYYYNPRTATSSWIWSRQIRLVIGQHNFCV